MLRTTALASTAVAGVAFTAGLDGAGSRVTAAPTLPPSRRCSPGRGPPSTFRARIGLARCRPPLHRNPGQHHRHRAPGETAAPRGRGAARGGGSSGRGAALGASRLSEALFSRLSTGYARYRPQYPDGLFDAIAAASLSHEAVWDCATGTGQAVRGLARHFAVVLASDASREQVAAAERHERARYLVARAEAVPLPSNSVCMVTVAQALHWLELAEFYAEARRVLRPGGLLVVWTYGRQRMDGGRVDAVVRRLLSPSDRSVLAPSGAGWRPAIARSVPLRGGRHPVPPMAAEWTLDQLLGYIGTWSAVARCRELTGVDPMSELADRLAPLWGDAACRDESSGRSA